MTPTQEQIERWWYDAAEAAGQDPIDTRHRFAVLACAWQREQDALICDGRVMALDHGGNAYRREATASQCAAAIRST